MRFALAPRPRSESGRNEAWPRPAEEIETSPRRDPGYPQPDEIGYLDLLRGSGRCQRTSNFTLEKLANYTQRTWGCQGKNSNYPRVNPRRHSIPRGAKVSPITGPGRQHDPPECNARYHPPRRSKVPPRRQTLANLIRGPHFVQCSWPDPAECSPGTPWPGP